MILFNKSKFSIFYLLLSFCFVFQSNYALRILGIFPFQMKSQFVMGEELLKALAAKGHRVDVYSHFPQKKSIDNYNDYSLQGTLPALTNNITYEDLARVPDPVKLMDIWLKQLSGPMCDLLGLPVFQKLIHDPPNDPSYDLAIMEFSISHCFIPFGRHLNIPVIGVQAISLYPWQYEGFGNPVNLASDPNFVTSYVTPLSFLERLGNFITHHRLVRLFHEQMHNQDCYIEKYFGLGLPGAAELQKDISLIFVNDDASIYRTKAYVPKVVTAPGLHIVDHNERLSTGVQKWLDESTSGCILFTFGSMIRIETLPIQIVQAFYKSFENIAPVRVLMKIAKPEDLPLGLPSNVFIQPWFQQGAVLKHKNTKVFVTHGGLMGTQESIYHEVSMIGIPIFFDQHFTLNAYVRKKIAIKLTLSELTEATFTRALLEVLNNATYRENVKTVSTQLKDRPINVMNNTIFWVEYIHRHGKDALKSSSEDVPWWQTSLLDIYAFFLILALISVFISVKLIKVIINVMYFFTRKAKKARFEKKIK